MDADLLLHRRCQTIVYMLVLHLLPVLHVKESPMHCLLPPLCLLGMGLLWADSSKLPPVAPARRVGKLRGQSLPPLQSAAVSQDRL